MFVEIFVYALTLLSGVAAFAMILPFFGFALTSHVVLFARNEDLEVVLIMVVLGLFLFLLGVNDVWSVLRCNQKIEAVYCGCNSYPGGRYGVTGYAPVFEYACNVTAYHEQTTQTVPYRLLQNMTEGKAYPSMSIPNEYAKGYFASKIFFEKNFIF